MASQADEGVGEVFQDVVSVLVSLGVVGFFEVVKIHDDEGIGDFFPRRPGSEVFLHIFFHGGLVQHPGEGICLCLLLVGIAGFLGFQQFMQGLFQLLVAMGEEQPLAFFLPGVVDGKNQGGDEQQQDAH